METALHVSTVWNWLKEHNDCLIRVGAGGAWLFDHDDLHWHLREDSSGEHLIQLMRGKQILGELSMMISEIVYVEMTPSSDVEGHFELQFFGDSEQEPIPLYYFVLAHGYEDETEQHRAAAH